MRTAGFCGHENWVSHIQTEITDIIMYLLINKYAGNLYQEPKKYVQSIHPVRLFQKSISRNVFSRGIIHK